RRRQAVTGGARIYLRYLNKDRTRSPLSTSHLSPHSAHAGADIHLGSLVGGTCSTGRDNWPARPLEQTEALFGDEAGSRCIEVTIALRMLAVDEKALRNDQVKVVLRAGHGDIEQSTFLL